MSKKKEASKNLKKDSEINHQEEKPADESEVVFDLSSEEILDTVTTKPVHDLDPLNSLTETLVEKSNNLDNLDVFVTDNLEAFEMGDAEISEDFEQTGFEGLSPETNEDKVEEIQLTDEEAISILESLLFISDRPVGLTTFKNAFANTNIDTKKIKDLIDEVKIDFAQTRRGVSLEEVDGAFQLRTKPDNQEFIKKILKPKIFKLTGPSLETLSIVAYKQPCIKSQVDEIRGVESGHLVRALMDKGLVAFDGKSDFPGRPMLYKTTRKFLEVFGLRNLNELPSLSEIEELLPEGIGEDDDKQTLSQLAGKLEENFEAQSYSIGEEELGKITEQLSDISTETEFFEIEKRKQRESRDRDRAEGIRENLILGEPVDPKDEKWLQRYEIKMNQDLQDGKLEKQTLEDANPDKDIESSEGLTDLVNEDPLDLL